MFGFKIGDINIGKKTINVPKELHDSQHFLEDSQGNVLSTKLYLSTEAIQAKLITKGHPLIATVDKTKDWKKILKLAKHADLLIIY